MKTVERHRLAHLEGVIERGLTTFVEVGRALAEIRDSKLYLDQSPTFEAYCKSRWGWNSSRARQIIGATAVVTRLESVTNVTPANEGQARPLTKLPAEQQPEAWRRATGAAAEAGEPVSARHVQAAVAEIENDGPRKHDPRVKHLRSAIREIKTARKMSERGQLATRLRAEESVIRNIVTELEG